MSSPLLHTTPFHLFSFCLLSSQLIILINYIIMLTSSTSRFLRSTATRTTGRWFSAVTSSAEVDSPTTTTSTTSTATAVSNGKDNTNKTNNLIWCMITGFSTFGHRLDLQLALGDIKPVDIDPLLDWHYFPSGKYALAFHHKDEITALKRHLSEKFMKRIQILDNLQEIKEWHRASEVGVSRSTVRLRGMPSYSKVKLSHLYYLFEDYALDHEVKLHTHMLPSHYKSIDNKHVTKQSAAIVPFKGKHQFENYFIHLKSPEEAERLVAEKGSIFIDGHEVSMLHYQA